MRPDPRGSPLGARKGTSLSTCPSIDRMSHAAHAQAGQNSACYSLSFTPHYLAHILAHMHALSLLLSHVIAHLTPQHHKGVTPDQYKKDYASGTLAAISEVSGVPANTIKAQLPPAATGSSGSRRLLQDSSAAAKENLKVGYELPTNDVAATTSKLQEATANGGEAFYKVCSVACVLLAAA